ncbi:General substrate transporter [Pleurostoma richardsiae]|uniref:General substrate transporter n=1 Tax=Pleurostoma richardsiae TaxID=41990 RepID=A0AA38R7A2_9PEZI|nr:General substrate transporter [Pleurostoma richardsiae]
MGPFNRLSGNWLVAAITLVNAASMSWFGYDQGVFSGVLIASDFKHYFPETKKANISGITSSCFSLGAFCGAIFAFTLGDKLGRKKTISLGLICNVVGAILQIVSWHLPQMIIGRVINGFGMGLTSSTCPVYQAECSRPSVRGKLVVMQSVCNTAAFCLANWMNYGLYFSGGALQWRFPLGFQLLFPVIVACALFFVPESPRWLLLHDRHEEALEVIARLEGKGVSIHDEAVTAEFLSIRTAIHHERKDRVPVRDVLMFRDKQQNFRRLLLSCGTQFMQQFSGVNALGYYLPTLLQQSVGFDEQMSRLMTGVNGTIYLCAALCCLLIIDRFGRRKMMLYGSVTMGSCYLIASMCLRAGQVGDANKKQMGNVTTAMFFMYYFFYGTSFAKVPWVYNSEVNSLGWRTRGAAAATATNWMGGFIVTQFTKVGVDNLKWGFYLIFAVICWAYFPIVFLLYPETSRRTLEDMDEIFIANPSPIVFNKAELTQRRRPQAFIDAETRRIGEGAATEIGATVLDKQDLDNVNAAHVEDGRVRERACQ